MAKLRRIVSTLFLLLSFSYASFSIKAEQTEVEYYKKDDITNQIPYFDNRFRIDAQLEEITLLFYRRSGTPPIILVRPDGSKLKIDNLPKDKVKWFDDRTFDMINIKQPMPGPWQAIGEISPNSKIMVVSEVTLKVEPLAEILLSGETLKIQGQIFNREKVIDDPLFDDVIELDVDFFSTNNKAFDNFGAVQVNMGSFRDDGYELDEYAKDGIFTAEFALDFSPGEWLPIYRVKMPMATRELRQKPVIVRENPISLEVKTTTESLQYHEVTINIDDSFVDPDSLIFQGKITFPDRQTEPFAIMEGRGINRLKKIGYTEPGVHRISLNAFGKTINGREFRMVVPEFTFNVDRKDGFLVPTLSDESLVDNTSEQSALEFANILAKEKEEHDLALAQAQEAQRVEAEAQQMQTLVLVGIINGLIVVMAVGVFVILRRKRNGG